MRPFDDQPHLAIAIALQIMRAVACIAKPVELGAFANGVGRELKQFAITEVAELGGTARIMTLRNHGQSDCANRATGMMDALKMPDRCPAPIGGQMVMQNPEAQGLIGSSSDY